MTAEIVLSSASIGTLPAALGRKPKAASGAV
jgi:hypothetical protein